MVKNAKKCKIKLVYLESMEHVTNFQLRLDFIRFKEKNASNLHPISSDNN